LATLHYIIRLHSLIKFNSKTRVKTIIGPAF
jgi:hypothetical protein